ncbi:MAG: hypothetical protein ACOCW7_01165 [Bacteroidota bacterium]
MKTYQFPILIRRDKDAEKLNHNRLFGTEKALHSVIQEWNKLEIGEITGIPFINLLIKKPIEFAKDQIFEQYKSQIPGADKFPPNRDEFLKNIKLPDMGNLVAKCTGLINLMNSGMGETIHVQKYFSFSDGKISRVDDSWDRYILKDSIFLENEQDLHIYRMLKMLEMCAKELQMPSGAKISRYVAWAYRSDGDIEWGHIRPDQFRNIRVGIDGRGVRKRLEKREDLLDDIVFNIDDLISKTDSDNTQ